MISVSFNYGPNCLVSFWDMFSKLVSIWESIDCFVRICIDFEILWIR